MKSIIVTSNQRQHMWDLLSRPCSWGIMLKWGQHSYNSSKGRTFTVCMGNLLHLLTFSHWQSLAARGSQALTYMPGESPLSLAFEWGTWLPLHIIMFYMCMSFSGPGSHDEAWELHKFRNNYSNSNGRNGTQGRGAAGCEIEHLVGSTVRRTKTREGDRNVLSPASASSSSMTLGKGLLYLSFFL